VGGPAGRDAAPLSGREDRRLTPGLHVEARGRYGRGHTDRFRALVSHAGVYSLLRQGVPARLVYYPDENHWVLKGQNSKHWYGEVLGWLARWLK
jgi:hypothetical protein